MVQWSREQAPSSILVLLHQCIHDLQRKRLVAWMMAKANCTIIKYLTITIISTTWQLVSCCRNIKALCPIAPLTEVTQGIKYAWYNSPTDGYFHFLTFYALAVTEWAAFMSVIVISNKASACGVQIPQIPRSAIITDKTSLLLHTYHRLKNNLSASKSSKVTQSISDLIMTLGN